MNTIQSSANSHFPVIRSAFLKTYRKSNYWALTLAVFINVLFLYYFLLVQKTTWDSFWQSNTALYSWLQVILSIINAYLIGISISLLFYTLEQRRATAKMTFMQTASSLLFSAAATGCSVCSAFLLPTLGIAASLTAFPFGGLEIKFLSILVLLYAIYQYSKGIVGICDTDKLKPNNNFFRIFTYSLKKMRPVLVLMIFVLIVYSLPKLPKPFRMQLQKDTVTTVNASASDQSANADVFAQVNPQEGYEISASYNDIGPKMIEMGVIDLDKFKDVYERSGQSLSQEQLDILTKGSKSKIKITPENSYFLLNFFWAFGLTNKSKILDEGDMMNYGGRDGAGGFASTGGWSLTKSGDPMQYYSNRALVPLNEEQEKLAFDVSSNVYRPCCGNSTAFPDCNHGMALLGILELMAAQGATEKEMYDASKYISSYWFPGNAFDLALYFKNKEGTEFKDIDSKTFVSNDYFSAFGAQNVKKWLIEQGIQEKPPAQGGGCGV